MIWLRILGLVFGRNISRQTSVLMWDVVALYQVLWCGRNKFVSTAASSAIIFSKRSPSRISSIRRSYAFYDPGASLLQCLTPLIWLQCSSMVDNKEFFEKLCVDTWYSYPAIFHEKLAIEISGQPKGQISGVQLQISTPSDHRPGQH